MTSNFNLVNWDTDSVTVCKPDGSPFSEEEQNNLLKALNNEFPEKISWEPDGYFKKVIVLKAKNYVLFDGKKTKIKGSALKSSKLEAACKEMQQEIIKAIIEDRTNFLEIYNKYVVESQNVTDIKRWASKKTYTEKIDSSTRPNETKIKDAIASTNYKQGDKMFMFFMPDETLCLIENFTGDYHKDKMAGKVFKSIQIFKNIMDVTTFLNYKLKRNKKFLDELLKV